MVAIGRYRCTNCMSTIVHLLVLAIKQAIGSFYPQHSGSRVRLFAWLQATVVVQCPVCADESFPYLNLDCLITTRICSPLEFWPQHS